jgi:hypothetical protein
MPTIDDTKACEVARELQSWNQAGHGDVRLIELDTRREVYVRQSQIAGMLAIKQDGPSRIIFSGGGHLDVCGAAGQLRLGIKIAEISERSGGGLDIAYRAATGGEG